MFFISLNILKALIVSIDMEIQSKNLNLRLGDRLEKKKLHCFEFNLLRPYSKVTDVLCCHTTERLCVAFLYHCAAKKTLRSTYHKQKSSLFDANRATETRTGDIGKLSLEL